MSGIFTGRPWLWRAALVGAALAPLLLFVVVEAQRPFPFTTTNDNWSYFFPLMSRVTDAWLDGHPLRVVWDVGHGWSPWDSGQVGWLSPVPVVAAAVTRLIGDPLLLLEVDAALHLLLLGVISLWVPPPRITGGARLAGALLLSLSPGPLLVGMNWHDYLTPAPWFLVLLGLVWRAVDDDRPWTARESVAVVVASLLFFSAAHPQMVVLGCAFLTLFAVTAGKSRVVVDVVGRLALAQIPIVPALAFLWLAAQHAAPTWRNVRDVGSVLERALTPLDGLSAVLFGPLFLEYAAGYFLPLLVGLVVVGLVRLEWRVVVYFFVVLVLLVPALFPPIRFVWVGPLESFRFTVKLAVYAGPITAALWLQLGARWHVPAGVVGALLSAAAVIAGNDAHTTLNAAHDIGARGLRDLGTACLDDAGIAEGDRVAFVGDLRYDRTFRGFPMGMVALLNHAAMTVGRETANVYEPLEPETLNVAHAHLTAFWRNRQLRTDDVKRMTLLRDSGVQWLLALHKSELAPLDARPACGMFVAAMPGARLLLPGLERDSDGTLTTTTAQERPPALTLARSLEWQRLDDGRWRTVPPLPATPWWIATVLCLLLTVLVVRHPWRLRRPSSGPRDAPPPGG